MSLRPIPPVRWQLTGNHWLSLPCIHPDTAAIHAIGIVHRGTRSAIEFAGDAGFVEGKGPPLIRAQVLIAGEPFKPTKVEWERGQGWLPTFVWSSAAVVVRGVIFAPYGRDVDVPGCVYALSIENRGSAALEAEVVLDGVLGARQHRVRTARPFEDDHRVHRAGESLILEGSSGSGSVALAISADAEAELLVDGASPVKGAAVSFSIRRKVTAAPGETADVAFYNRGGTGAGWGGRDGCGAAAPRVA